ncbi:MAG: hypothetical protein JHC88_03270, partial [Niveispirillum sp.]|nr:hypothetical protein [Niveispirillum sp.]
MKAFAKYGAVALMLAAMTGCGDKGGADKAADAGKAGGALTIGFSQIGSES